MGPVAHYGSIIVRRFNQYIQRSGRARILGDKREGMRRS
jgi:hypothetical protein